MPRRSSTRSAGGRRTPSTACAPCSEASRRSRVPSRSILISEGLIFDGLGSETDELAAIAADARVTLDVLLLDVPQFDATQSRRPTTPREDRDLQITGLEQLAGASRGELYRINVTADFAFDRISRSLDGYYLLGVESRPDDRNGRRHRIGVKTTRRGVTIRSRRSFVTAMSAKATTPVDAVSRAIRSPLPINDLPLKISTWTYKDPGSAKVRVLVAAEAERLLDQPLDYTVGMAIVNRQGRGVAPPAELKKLVEKSGDPGTAVFSGILVVDPGSIQGHSLDGRQRGPRRQRGARGHGLSDERPRDRDGRSLARRVLWRHDKRCSNRSSSPPSPARWRR